MVDNMLEWHVWGFPNDIRICFTNEFRKILFNKLKVICGSRYRLAKLLSMHPMTIKEYELGKSSTKRPVFIPVFVLKKLIVILEDAGFLSLIADIEKNITEIRLKGGRGLVVSSPILPIKECEQLYSFVAHMIGDGCAANDTLPYYCGPDRELIESFKEDLQMFGIVTTK